MPTYEYRCDACGHKFERFQSITAEPIKQCPACKKKKARRLIGTGAGLIFKGSGFYITDYRSEGYKQKAQAEAGGTGSKPSGESSAPDSKPAAKADSATAAKTEAAPAAKAESTPAPKPEAKRSSKKR